nr:TIGR00366 family protein [Beijerinckia indica]
MKVREGWLEKVAIRVTAWSERWFPDAYVFALLALIIVALCALANGTPIEAVAQSFGDGFWGLIPFTMQMAMLVIGGYCVARSPAASWLIEALARFPQSARGTIVFVAIVAITTSLVHWAFSTVFCALLVRTLARREDLRFDYRAASAAAYLGLGAVWALGISSSAAQLQANPASMPEALLKISGVLPFSQTIFLWQSMLMLGAIAVSSILICYFSAPLGERTKTAADMGVDAHGDAIILPPRSRPGEWLEYSPILTLFVFAVGMIWVVNEFAHKGALRGISDLNSYNLMFLLFGMLLNWRPKRFLIVVAKAVPATAGVLIQFPIYSAIAFLISRAKGAGGLTLTDHLTTIFVSVATRETFAPLVGIYSAVLGFFMPSGGGKWLVEAPYVMQAAVNLKAHLGWAVQAYNAGEALPNLINPFWMLPLLGVLGLQARDIVGFTFLQLAVHLPVVVFLLWLLSYTLAYVPPMMP